MGQPRRPHYPSVHLPLYVIAGLYLGSFVYALAKNNWGVANLQENPFIGPPASIWHDLGAVSTASLLDGGQYWRLLTSLFLSPGETFAKEVNGLRACACLMSVLGLQHAHWKVEAICLEQQHSCDLLDAVQVQSHYFVC